MARRLVEFVRNGDVNAINYFAIAQDSLKRNQFGGTVGGKIIRNRLFLRRYTGDNCPPEPFREQRIYSNPGGFERRLPVRSTGLAARQMAKHAPSRIQRQGLRWRMTSSAHSLRSGRAELHEVYSSAGIGKFLRQDFIRSARNLQCSPIRQLGSIGRSVRDTRSTAAIFRTTTTSQHPSVRRIISIRRPLGSQPKPADLRSWRYLFYQDQLTQFFSLYLRREVCRTLPEFQWHRPCQAWRSRTSGRRRLLPTICRWLLPVASAPERNGFSKWGVGVR